MFSAINSMLALSTINFISFAVILYCLISFCFDSVIVSPYTFKVKLITQKNSEEAFEAFKNNAISKYSFITNVEIGTETIEDK